MMVISIIQYTNLHFIIIFKQIKGRASIIPVASDRMFDSSTPEHLLCFNLHFFKSSPKQKEPGGTNPGSLKFNLIILHRLLQSGHNVRRDDDKQCQCLKFQHLRR